MVTQATQDFIRLHCNEDVRQLALLGRKQPEVDLKYALEQIAGRQKARTKLPSWAIVDDIIYPPHLSMEQCSSETTALYKARIAGSGDFMVDLTAGFGVDAAFISKGFKRVVTVEQLEQLCVISSANFRRLGLNHIEVVCGNGVEYLHTLEHADLLFIDPARRDEHGARTFGVADCTPNVLELIDEMIAKSDRVMVKLSPMLDWRKAVADIGWVREVHIVSVDNECKELLLVASMKEQPLRLYCVNNGDVFECDAVESAGSAIISMDTTPSWLYEPNASIMKAGCFRVLSERFHLTALDRNSHLFVSDEEVTDFPGRRFVIDKLTSMNKRELKVALSGIQKANITVRNFPMTVAELRKRLKLQDGGDTYIFATTVAGKGHQLFVCRKKS